jgi:hypothetical protein
MLKSKKPSLAFAREKSIAFVAMMLLTTVLVIPAFGSGGPIPVNIWARWNDNFDFDPSLNGWNCTTGGSGVFRKNSTVYYSSPYSFYMKSYGASWAYAVAPYYTATYPNSNATLSLINYSKNYKVEFYFYLPTINNHWISVFFNRQIDTVIDDGTEFTARWGGNNNWIIALNTTTWYRITYSVNASASKYYVDIYNTKLGKNVVTSYACNFDPASFKTFLLGDFETGANNWGEAYWDDISIYFVSLQPTWYTKPPYPDYAPSGTPDFDQRQDNWWWRSWAYPDAIAVWQHYSDVFKDWDIYYSIYTDVGPNGMWWTLGTDYARPIVSDWGGHAEYWPGDDKQPAISWYSNKYAICVWQHQTGDPVVGWDIWYSVFTPNLGWSTPGPIVPGGLGLDDTDPAIAFDTNGWAVCTWVHGPSGGPTVVYYSVWDPRFPGVPPNWGTWIGPNALLGGGAWPGQAHMPEVDIDQNHNAVAIWTDGAPTQVYYSFGPFVTPIPPGGFPWAAPAIVPGCPPNVNWKKGISPDALGNNLMDFGFLVPSDVYYAKFIPGVGWVPATKFSLPPNPTDGEMPDLAYDLNNNAIAVYSAPNGQIYYSFWNGANWQPAGGKFAATANAGMDQWPAVAFIKNNKAVLVWQAYPEPYTPSTNRSEMYYSVYTPTYPADSWTKAKKIWEPNNPLHFLMGDDYYVDIASPTGSATTPPSVPPPITPPQPADTVWTYCGPTAVANSLWWFDSKYEPNSIPPPTKSDGFTLVKSYNASVWDDHDPRNVKPLIEHLAWLMDTDGQRTKLCHQGTTVWDMQAGITQYLSWSGVNPLGDVNGDGVVNQTDVNIVNAAMNSKPGMPNWNLAADIWPETVLGPKTADNTVSIFDLGVVTANLGRKGLFYENTSGLYPSFNYIEGEVEKCESVVVLLGFYQDGIRYGGHYVTIAGVNSTTQQLLISNPIRDDFEAGNTPGRSPVAHSYPHNSTIHNNASLVSQDAYYANYNSTGGYWLLNRYLNDSIYPANLGWETRIEHAVVISPRGVPDIAVTNLMVCYGQTVLAQNRTHHINVTITNQGIIDENPTLTLYWNTTNVIATTNVFVPAGTTKTVTFQWVATQKRYKNYTLSAVATPVPGELNTTNNIFTGSTVIIAWPGDVDADKLDGKYEVGILDVVKITGIYASKYPQPQFKANPDIDCTGNITILDVVLCTGNYAHKES